MKHKQSVLLTIFITIFLMPKIVMAKTICDSFSSNNSKSECEKNTDCSWHWINEDAGDGYCKLKFKKKKCEDLTEQEKANVDYCVPSICSYSVEIHSLKIPGDGKTTCTFTIEPTGDKNSLIIKWQDPKSGTSGEFGHDGVEYGQYHDSFMCYDESVFFWNANAGLTQEGPGGIEEVIYPFKNKWNDIYTKTGQCPKIRYVSDAGNTYLYFPTEGNDNEPPSTAGGSHEAGGAAEDEGEKTKPDNNTGLSDEEQKAEEIKNQYIGNMTCGGITNFKFHKRIPKLTSTFYNLLKVAIPVLLVIKGMMDLFKAMSAGKEDEMKKNQKKFINRLIAGFCAFIVFVLVETIIGWIAPKTGDENAMNCVNCFINNKGCVEIAENKNNSNNDGGSGTVQTTKSFSVPFEDGVSYTVTDEFRYRVNPVTGKNEYHLGIDLVAPENSYIVASAPGSVTLAKANSATAGNYVIIEHTSNDSTKYYTVYMHMSKLLVSKGDVVTAKQRIGVIGKTGQVTGLHLHFELCRSQDRNYSTCINPRNFIAFK